MSKFRLANYVSILVVSRQFGHTEWGQIYTWVSEHGLFPFWFAFMQTAVNHQNIKQLNNTISLSKHTLFKINYLIYISFSQTWLLASYWAVLSYKIEDLPKKVLPKRTLLWFSYNMWIFQKEKFVLAPSFCTSGDNLLITGLTSNDNWFFRSFRRWLPTVQLKLWHIFPIGTNGNHIWNICFFSCDNYNKR